jgi:cyclopropane fatty-acyl-phospholipid synthase-like methyltransferase
MEIDYNIIAEDYQKASSHPIKQYIESYTLLRQLGDVAGKSVLDLACGDGYYTRLIKQQGAAQVVGVDISEAMINNAEAQETATALGIEYRVQDVIELGQIGSFDAVTAVYLFPYATSKQTLTAMMQTVYNNLKPGGKLAAITLHPNLQTQDLAIYPQYGIQITTPSILQDGGQITFTVDIPNDSGSLELRVTHWQQQTMEQAAQRAGFQKINWQALQISREGLEQYPKDYWQALLKQPYSTVLVACK